MRAVDLDDGFDDPLFDGIEPVELLIENSSRSHRVDGLEIGALPPDIQHHRQRPLGVAPFLRTDGAGAEQLDVPVRPRPDLRRQRVARAGEEIGHRRQIGEEIRRIPGFLLLLVVNRRGRPAREKAADRQLQHAVLRRRFVRPSARIDGADPADRAALFCVNKGKADRNMVLSQPADQFQEAAVHPQNLRREVLTVLLIVKGRAGKRVTERAGLMMAHAGRGIRQHQNRMLRRGRAGCIFI